MGTAVRAVATFVARLFTIERATQIAVNAAAAYALGEIRQRLAGGERPNLLSDDLNTLTAGAVTECVIVYGETGIAGEVVFQHVHNDRQWITYIIQLADGGQVLPHEFVKCIVDGEEVTFDGSGAAIGRYASGLAMRFFGGHPDQTADAWLVANSGGRWTANHRGRSRVYALLGVKEADQGLFPNGRPSVIFVIKGRRVYDPRLDSTAGGSGSHRLDDESTWAWSDNVALCAADMARGITVAGKRFAGLHMPSRLLDPEWLAEAADVCDAQGWTLNGAWTTGQDPAVVLQAIADHMAGRIITRKGRLAFIAGDVRAPVLTLGEDDLAGGLSLEAARPWRNVFNTATARYRDADAGYEMAETNPLPISAWVAEDGGREIRTDYEFAFTADRVQCVRLAKAKLVRQRFPRTLEAAWKLRAAVAGEGDLVTVNLPSYGISETYEVETRSLDPAGFVSMTLRQFDPAAALAFDEAEAGAAPTFAQIDRGTRAPPNATGWTAAALAFTAGAVQMPGVLLTGSPPDFISGVLIEMRLAGTTEWAAASDAIGGRVHLGPLLPSTDYEFSIRYRVGAALSASRQIVAATTGASFAAGSAATVAWPGVTGAGIGEQGLVNAEFNQGALGVLGWDSYLVTDAVGPDLLGGAGAFDSATGWGLGAGWSITGGQAVRSAQSGFSNLTRSGALTIGVTYRITIVISTISGTLNVFAGGGAFAPLTTPGTHTLTLTAAGSTALHLQAASGPTTVSIESVTVRPALALLSGRNLVGYFGQPMNVMWSLVSGTPIAGCIFYGWKSASNSLADLLRFGLPVVAGDRVYAGALMARFRCTAAEAVVFWYGPTGTFLSASLAGSGGRNAGGVNGAPANFDVVGGFVTAPAGAAFAVFAPRGVSDGGVDPYIFWARPILARVPAGQTTPPLYNPGRSDPLADVTGSNTAADFVGRGGLATANYYRQSSDPGAVSEGSIWTDTSASSEVVRQRIGGAWVAIANNAPGITDAERTRSGSGSGTVNTSGVTWVAAGSFSLTNIGAGGRLDYAVSLSGTGATISGGLTFNGEWRILSGASVMASGTFAANGSADPVITPAGADAAGIANPSSGTVTYTLEVRRASGANDVSGLGWSLFVRRTP